MRRGASLPLEKCWELAKAWYGAPRTKLDWRRRTVEETREVFGALGLVGDFWAL